jgi:hypothetical protein
MAMIPTTDALSAGSGRAMPARANGRTRREGPAEAVQGSAARELDAEVTRLLRVRGGELAGPLAWARPSLWRNVHAVLAQLEPIRSRAALLSSWEREAARGPDVRLAYAMAWLSMDRRLSAGRARRRGSRVSFSAITAHG